MQDDHQAVQRHAVQRHAGIGALLPRATDLHVQCSALSRIVPIDQENNLTGPVHKHMRVKA